MHPCSFRCESGFHHSGSFTLTKALQKLQFHINLIKLRWQTTV